MTDRNAPGDDARLAQKAVRAHALLDPLGAKGFRRPAERIERERRARRLTVVAAIASFVGIFGAIVATAPEQTPSTAALAPPQSAESRVAMEIPIPSTGPDDPGVIIRIIAPDEPAASEVRTRAS